MDSVLIVDPVLPHLQRALDANSMKSCFQALFDRVYRRANLTVLDCVVELARYRPEKRCRVLYRLRFRDGSGARFEQLFSGILYPLHRAQAQREKSEKAAQETETFFQSVLFWPELCMVLWTFPFDRSMKHLPLVGSEELIKETVEENLDALNLRKGSVCTSAQISQVKYTPGQRCVYGVRVEIRDGSSLFYRDYFLKTYVDGRSRDVYDALRGVDDSWYQGEGGLEIPKTVLHQDSLNCYWQEAWQGESYSKYYEKQNWDAEIPRIARALSALHQAPFQQIGHDDDLGWVGQRAMEGAEELNVYSSSCSSRIDELARRIVESYSRAMPDDGLPTAPIHGAFRMSQLLGQGDRIAITDFDGLTLGDPHQDVAEFMVSLLIQHSRRGLSIREMMGKGRLFKEHYQEQVPWKLNSRRLSWLAASLLLRKVGGAFKGVQQSGMRGVDETLDLVEHQLKSCEA